VFMRVNFSTSVRTGKILPNRLVEYILLLLYIATKETSMAVTVYSTPLCPDCTMTKNDLQGKGIPFAVNARVMVGFKSADIEAALRR